MIKSWVSYKNLENTLVSHLLLSLRPEINFGHFKMRIALVVLGMAVLASSCVPNRKIVYLQKDDLKNRKEIPRDTILRTHPLKIQEYRIQPLDNLMINFETLSKEQDSFDFLSKLSTVSRGGAGAGASPNLAALNGILVNTAGEIEYPVLGKFNVGGLTLFQAQDSIRKIAMQYIPDVVVRVRMLNFRYTVLGEVNQEGTVISPNTRLTFSEAVGLSGGLTELADRSLVKVLRQNGGTTEVFYINLLDEQFTESPYYFVQQNDVIIVPPLKQRPFRKYFTSNLAVITSSISFVLFIITLSK
jgi:polysaccharide biosynthesis/export protein